MGFFYLQRLTQFKISVLVQCNQQSVFQFFVNYDVDMLIRELAAKINQQITILVYYFRRLNNGQKRQYYKGARLLRCFKVHTPCGIFIA